MKLRLQPRDVIVPDNDHPFLNDLLGREQPIKVLTQLVENIEGPCVLAIDAPWGGGKSTFINMWARYLLDSGFAVVKFNAWESDYSDDPFVTLSTEILEGFPDNVLSDFESGVDALTRTAKKVVRRSIPGILRLAASTIPVVGSEVGQTLAAIAEDRFSAYGEARQSVREFREVLQEMANKLADKQGGRQLVVFIDELDRCRPTYAIELLEVAKHLFSVDHIVFVLAINRDQLAHSIQGVYGPEFDAVGYLRRFIDYDIRLPYSDPETLVLDALNSTGISERLKNTAEIDYWDVQRALSLVTIICASSKMSPRDIVQAIHRLGVAVGSLSEQERPYMLTLVALMMIRTVNPGLCHRIEMGELTDQDAVEALFKTGDLESMRGTEEGNLVEAVIIAAKIRSGVPIDEQLEHEQSPLLKHYRERERVYPPNNPDEQRDLDHARGVVALVKKFFEPRPAGSGVVYDHLGFQKSVERLELLSQLLGDS